MNIPKAITRLIDLKDGLDLPDMAAYEDALEQGIKALQLYEHCSGCPYYCNVADSLFPRETKD